MSWFSLLRVVLTLFSKILAFVEREKLMTAGEARILAKQTEELNERVRKAVEARDAVAADADAGKLRDDDGYRRD